MEAAGSRPRVALLAGASGLTGGALLKLLLRDDTFSRVIALSRRPLPVEHARFANRILRFEELELRLKGLHCTDAFCALGAAGGPRAAEPALRAVDLQLVMAFARAAHAAGATRLVVVSAAGARKDGAHPFQRVKGEMEAGLREVGFAALDILQPGVVFGPRREDGLGASLRQGVLAIVSPMLRRSKELNALSGEQLAGAMLAVARSRRRGANQYSGDSLASAVQSGRTP